MTNFALKQKLNECFLYADEITIQGYGPAAGGLSLREMIKFDLLQIIGFLYDPAGISGNEEIAFISEYLTIYMSPAEFTKFRYDRCMGPDFINTPPRSLSYFAKADLSGSARRCSSGMTRTRFFVEVITELGREFISLSLVTTPELSNLSNYSIVLENFLKEYNLYNSGTPGELLTQDILARNGKPPRYTSKKSNKTANGKASNGKNAGTAANASASSDASQEPEETLEQLMEELNSLTGLESVKQDIQNIMNLIKIRKIREERGMKQPSVSLHLVFSGNPGTGKTTVARLLARIYKALGVARTGQLIEVDRSGLVEGYVGQTAIKTKEVVESALGGILFIDEAYTLVAKNGEKDFGQEAIDTILKLMEDNRDDLIVIVAGYTDKMEEFVNSNPGLKSRFNKYIFFQDYSGPELTSIFKSMCVKEDYLLASEALSYVEEYLDILAKAHEENFANARTVRNYMERCIARQADRLVTCDMEKMDDDAIRTLVLDDVKENAQ